MMWQAACLKVIMKFQWSQSIFFSLSPLISRQVFATILAVAISCASISAECPPEGHYHDGYAYHAPAAVTKVVSPAVSYAQPGYAAAYVGPAIQKEYIHPTVTKVIEPGVEKAAPYNYDAYNAYTKYAPIPTIAKSITYAAPGVAKVAYSAPTYAKVASPGN